MDSQQERQLPENMEAEQSVLGSVLIDSDHATEKAMERLQGNEFANSGHRKIFKAMQELHQEGTPIDLILLTDRLRVKGWLGEGTVSYLGKLAHSVPTASNVDYYISVVKEVHTQRQLIINLNEQLEQAHNLVPSSEIIASAQSSLEEISDQTTDQKKYRMIRDILPDVFEEVEHRYTSRNNGMISGIPSGYKDLDSMTDGFQKSDLIIIGARPSVGKTAFALNIARNAATERSDTVAIFSLEMSEKQLVGRMICAEGNIDASRFRTGNFEPDDWTNIAMAIGQIGELSIVIEDTPALSIAEIRSKCRKIKREQGLGMILIDYLQLISGRGKSGESRQEEVSHISRTLKQIAKELDVPVIALSQLSRGVEQRQDKRPMMSDLRESGSIEQDADIVSFLYRDDYYDKETEKKNIIEIIIAKQRNGPVGTVELVFLKNFNKFVNLDRAHQNTTKTEPVHKKEQNKRVPDMYRIK